MKWSLGLGKDEPWPKKLLRRAILDPSILDKLPEWSPASLANLTDFIPQIHRVIVFKSLRYFHSLSFFVFFPPFIEFSSNFESGGEESALLVLFIMEIDLTLICIYLHRHQADLESEGGCNLLGSWQICSKNRALELSNQLWRACSLALLISE